MRILLVEDDDDAALALMTALSLPVNDRRYQVVHVSSLQQAIATAVRGDVDAAVVDLGLPDSDGLDAPQVLHQAAPRLPIVVLTGHKSDEDALTLIRLGIQDYLLKGEASVNRIRQAVDFAIERTSVDPHPYTA